MGFLAPILGQAAPLLGGLTGGLLNKQAAGKRTADLNEIINNQRRDYGLGRDTLFGTGGGSPGMFSNLADPSLTDMNRQLQYLYGGDQGGAFGNLNDMIGRVYNQPSVNGSYGYEGGFDPYGQNTPGLQQAMQGFGGLLPQMQGQSQLANQVFQGGGWTPQSQTSFDNLGQLMGGQGVEQQGMRNMANNIFGSNGQSQNPLWTSFMNASSQGIGNGGMTDALGKMQDAGQFTLQSGGLTPTGAMGEQAALKVLQNEGSTPTTDRLQDIGLNLAGQPSLLPMNRVATMARDEAGTAYQNNMEAAQRNAQARGGGAGSNVFSGLQNQGMADYADKGAEMEAGAVRDALLKQQALQLQQAQMGGNMAQGGGTLQNNRFGTAADTLSSLEGVAANRFGTGGSLIDRASGAATNRANVFGNLGLGSNAQNLQALGMGADMYGQNTNSMVGANNAYNNLIGTQGQYALGAGQLANQGSNSMADIIQAMMGGNLTAANQGLNRTGQYYDTQNSGLGALGKQQAFSAGQQKQGASQYGDIMNLMFPFMQRNGELGNASAWQNADPGTNPWAGLAGQAVTGAVGGAAQKLGAPQAPATGGGWQEGW